MPTTVHENILSYMNLSENRKQVGYPQLHEAAKLSWYKLFKKTRESVVRKWVDVHRGKADYPCSLENLIGVLVVDSCGDLQVLDEDNQKNDLPRPPSKCTCPSCTQTDCLCPLVEDTIVQTDVVIDGDTYTNKTVTRVLKNGEVVIETHQWVPSYDTDGEIKSVVDVSSQTVSCTLDTLPCGCVADTVENVETLSHCGCLVCFPPWLRERYPAMQNNFGYYKSDDDNRKVTLYDNMGRPSRITQAIMVFQSNGADMLVPDYARLALIALLNWVRKMYSPMFDREDRNEAKRNFTREKNDMLKYLNPIPYEEEVEVSDPRRKLPFYRGIHSDFIAPAAAVVTAAASASTGAITNITYTNIGVPNWLKEIVDGGDPESPVSGLSTYSSPRLVGLGNKTTPIDRVSLVVDTQQMVNWGQAASFTINKITGTITWTNGFVLQPLSSLEIDLNQ